jgi:hypothetical protein
MPSSWLRARSALRLAGVVSLLVAAACRGRNDGNRSPYGGSSDGEGGTPPEGPRAGMSTDTTTAPTGAPAAATPPGATGAPGGASKGGVQQKPDSAKS